MALTHVSAGEVVHLGPVGSASNQKSKTHALVKTNRFEAAQLMLPRGTSIRPHSVEGHISLFCIEGAITLEANRTVEMRAGDWLYLEGGERHALTAHEDSSLLLTILFE
ncbi:cupin domain-containing protein [Sphingomonas segetis]|uniref:cupin domain-containing protein n=1 Tax=Sphingomonas segetis TaxID=1104779 RepID=UPI0012D3288E|nr:cupin domain-containing protein [Sphingomonas segetis]